MKRVVIVGAGPAGLTAAYKLLKTKQYEVIVIEKDSISGGISKTINYKENYMDLGGHRFFTKRKEVMDIWNTFLDIQNSPSKDDKELNRIKKYPIKGKDPEKEDNVFLIRNRVSRIYYNKKFFDYPITLSLKTIKNLGFFNTFLAGLSYLKSCFIKKKEDNLENFYINRFGKRLYKTFFYEYTKKLWGIEPSLIDASWGSQRVKGLSIRKVLKNAFLKLFHIKSKNVETSLIEEFYYPKYGPGLLYSNMAKYINENDGKILYQHEVIKIHKKGNKINAVTVLSNEQEKIITGDIFISTMPIKDLFLGMNLSKKIKEIASNLPYRDFITVGLLVKNLKLKNETNIKTINNIPPDCWIYIQEKNVKIGRIQIFNNWSPYLVKDKDTVFLGLEYFCTENDELWQKKDLEIKELAVLELEKMQIIENSSVLDFHVERVKKAYPAYFGSYEDFPKLKSYLTTFTNLYCIGRNGQHRYNNMDHSMLSAIVCTDLITGKITDKELLWQVNTENNYIEEKNEKDN